MKDTRKPDPSQHEGCLVVLQVSRTTYNVLKHVLPSFHKRKGKGKVSNCRRIYTADYKIIPLNTTFTGDTNKQPGTLLCFPVLMHPGHQQESLRGEGQGWEHPVCTLCIWDEEGWDCRMLSSTSLHQPHPGLSSSKAVPTHHCQAQLLPIWHHRVCLEVTRGIFMSAPGHVGRVMLTSIVQKESKDTRKHLYRAVLVQCRGQSEVQMRTSHWYDRETGRKEWRSVDAYSVQL